MTRLTAITGGIGSGKSVVSRILMVMGYDVFDCDREAKRIMDSDSGIKRRIYERISPDAISPDDKINRAILSQIVFNDPDKLSCLNTIVHQAVKEELIRWAHEQHSYGRAFVETAILYQSGLDKIVDDVIEVVAPDDVRIERVMRRNNCSETEVRARIQSQQFTPETPHSHIKTLINDSATPILPQLTAVL